MEKAAAETVNDNAMTCGPVLLQEPLGMHSVIKQ